MMMTAVKSAERIRAVVTIHKRDLRLALFGPVLHVVTTLSILIAIVIIRNYLNYIKANGIYPMPDLFSFPFRWAIIATGVYLAFSTVVTISRERESGTMELLFYGPVDHVSYVFGKYMAQVTLYLMILALYTVCFLTLSWMARIQLSASFFITILISVFTGSYLIAIGIFVSSISRSVRNATLVFLGIVMGALLIQGTQSWLSSIAPESDYYNPVLLLQQVVSWTQVALTWLSPFSYLNHGVDEMLRGNMKAFVGTIALAISFCLIFLTSSVLGLKFRGVRQ